MNENRCNIDEGVPPADELSSNNGQANAGNILLL
jgi:hypothetical protein